MGFGDCGWSSHSPVTRFLLADRGAIGSGTRHSSACEWWLTRASVGLYNAAEATQPSDEFSSAPVERFHDREYVTEAVFEDLEVKAEVLANLDRICPPDA